MRLGQWWNHRSILEIIFINFEIITELICQFGFLNNLHKLITVILRLLQSRVQLLAFLSLFALQIKKVLFVIFKSNAFLLIFFNLLLTRFYLFWQVESLISKPTYLCLQFSNSLVFLDYEFTLICFLLHNFKLLLHLLHVASVCCEELSVVLCDLLIYLCVEGIYLLFH
jgi:hypothetical protein